MAYRAGQFWWQKRLPFRMTKTQGEPLLCSPTGKTLSLSTRCMMKQEMLSLRVSSAMVKSQLSHGQTECNTTGMQRLSVPELASERGQSTGLMSGGCGHDSCMWLPLLSPAQVLLVMSEISILLATISHFLSVLSQRVRAVSFWLRK